jgi:type VI secretion system protein VasG
MPTQDALARALKPELDKAFKPAFVGRTVIIPFYPVRDEALRAIIVLKLAKVQRRLREVHRVELMAGEDVLGAIAARCTEVESGARNIDNILTNTLLPSVSRVLLEALVSGDKPGRIQVGVGSDGEFVYDAGGGAGVA